MSKKKMLIYILVIVVVLFFWTGQACFKKGMAQLSLQEMEFGLTKYLLIIKSFFTNKYMFFGICSAGLGFLTWLTIISRVDLTYITPISATVSTIALFIVAAYILKENITIYRIIGTLVVLMGILIIFLEKIKK